VKSANEFVSESTGLKVKQYIEDMFSTTKDKEDRSTVKYATRNSWMNFLGCAVGKYFNPVFPRHSGDQSFITDYFCLFSILSGVDTKAIMETVAASLRKYIFGEHLVLQYKREKDQKVINVDLPRPKGFLKVSFSFVHHNVFQQF
jgi:hypothetical protein